MLLLVDSDVLGVETEHFIDASQSSKSTVGLMVQDGLVTNLLVGGESPSVTIGQLLLVIASLHTDAHS